MRVLKGIIIVLVTLLSISCAPRGLLSMSEKGVSVTVANEIVQDERKLHALKKYKVVGRIHEQVVKRNKKIMARRSLLLKVNITFFRLKTSRFSSGVGRIGADVVVEEGGREVYTFKTSSTTVKRSHTSAKRMSKDLGKKIYKEIMDL